MAVRVLTTLIGIVAASNCALGPCVPGNDQCSSETFADRPGYHLQDTSCDENDPNGPFFDPVHGVIHHFYQKHIAFASGAGPIWGHWVSRDFVHWAPMPVAIWNGIDVARDAETAYDFVAIYTGSATVMPGLAPDGVSEGAMIIYPGLCTNQTWWWPGCETGTLMAVAVPADYANDPLLTNWTKPHYNPIVEGTQRDPSSAWQTSQGEWRFTSYDASIFGAGSTTDAIAGRWRRLGTTEGLPVAECPSMMAMPRPTEGFEAEYSRLHLAGRLPSHVYKFSADGKDWVIMGNLVEETRGHAGRFETAPGAQDLYDQRRILDAGSFYASKDSLYPSAPGGNGAPRRINWGWATIAHGAQTLPRELTFNAAVMQLEQRPIEELKQLRQDHLAGSKPLDPAQTNLLGLAGGSGRQCEAEITFELPSSEAELVVEITGQSAGNTSFFVAYTPPEANSNSSWYEVQVGVRFGTSQIEDTLRLLPDETSVTIRLFVDHMLSEVFFQHGRVVMTKEIAATDDSDLAIHIRGAAGSASWKVWQMKSVWVSPETVLMTPRMDQPVPAEVQVVVL